MKNQKNKCLLLIFILYILFVIKVIVFKYSYAQLQEIVNGWQKDVIWEGLSTANFTPLKTIKMYIRYYELPGIRSFANLFGNVLIFVPFGMLLPMIHKASQNIMVLLANGFLFVLGIEVFQLFSAFGAFDVDDIMLNCLGVLIGGVLYHILTRMFRKY
ncbi:MAG: VanZ family protein [Lachnospiraceae bacterium]|nr:VanZ family protein [Lachnospiraceae bacterium]